MDRHTLEKLKEYFGNFIDKDSDCFFYRYICNEIEQVNYFTAEHSDCVMCPAHEREIFDLKKERGDLLRKIEMLEKERT
jgi:hypothetical protein